MILIPFYLHNQCQNFENDDDDNGDYDDDDNDDEGGVPVFCRWSNSKMAHVNCW